MDPTEPTDPPRKFYGLKPREFDRVNAPGKIPEKSTAHDVHAMLQQNRDFEQRTGIDEIEIKEVKSRRKRDYWLLLGLSAATFGMIAGLGRTNPIVVVFAGSGMALATVGITWIMWFVMDKY